VEKESATATAGGGAGLAWWYIPDELHLNEE
jgi:hypothetical protein